MDVGASGGLVAAVVAVVGLFKLREGNLSKKLEIEKRAQEMLFERLHQLEFREMAREKRVDEFQLQLAEMRHKHDKLQWEYEELVKDYKDLEHQFQAEQKHTSELRDTLFKLYNDYEGAGRVRPLLTPRKKP